MNQRSRKYESKCTKETQKQNDFDAVMTATIVLRTERILFAINLYPWNDFTKWILAPKLAGRGGSWFQAEGLVNQQPPLPATFGTSFQFMKFYQREARRKYSGGANILETKIIKA